MCGLFIGIMILQQYSAKLPDVPPPVAAATITQVQAAESAAVEEPAVIRCATEVNTSGWVRYRNTTLSFELRHPDSYTMVEDDGTLVLTPNDTSSGLQSITFTPLRDTLQRQWTDGMELASWKIADRQTFAFTTPSLVDDHNMFHWSYLFIRGFPTQGEGAYYHMLRADVSEPKSGAFRLAQRAGIADLQATLTPSEEILSTFRFLHYEELNKFKR